MTYQLQERFVASLAALLLMVVLNVSRHLAVVLLVKN